LKFCGGHGKIYNSPMAGRGGLRGKGVESEPYCYQKPESVPKIWGGGGKVLGKKEGGAANPGLGESRRLPTPLAAQRRQNFIKKKPKNRAGGKKRPKSSAALSYEMESKARKRKRNKIRRKGIRKTLSGKGGQQPREKESKRRKKQRRGSRAIKNP